MRMVIICLANRMENPIMTAHPVLLRSEPVNLRDRAVPRVVPAEDLISSQALLKGRREVLIQHGDRVYRLRHTSNDKLILTK
ncbi:hemin transporter HemP [Xanthomonas dyei]|uniref:Hemin transporter HemP n=3 Tax=Xanthomonas TaxID=338 RepID=A0A2S7C744_9XANT|nr:hemin transporter HemP [Xanthomonas dyei]